MLQAKILVYQVTKVRTELMRLFKVVQNRNLTRVPDTQLGLFLLESALSLIRFRRSCVGWQLTLPGRI